MTTKTLRGKLSAEPKALGSTTAWTVVTIEPIAYPWSGLGGAAAPDQDPGAPLGAGEQHLGLPTHPRRAGHTRHPGGALNRVGAPDRRGHRPGPRPWWQSWL